MAAGIPVLIPALFAANGVSPAAGAKIYAYLKSTVTPESVFVDADMTTPATNPVVCNSLAAKVFYLDPAKAMDLVAKTSDDATTLFSVTYNVDANNITLGTGWEDVLELPAAGILDNLGGVSYVATQAELKALSTASYANGAAVLMQGLTTAGDRGGGLFRRVTGDQSALVVAATKTVSAVSTGSDTLTATAHGFVSGQGVIASAADAGLSLNTVYYVNRIDANTVSLHTTIVLALAGTSKVDITALAGSLSLKSLYDPKQAVYVIATGESLSGSSGVWVRDIPAETYAVWWGLNPLGVVEGGNTEALNAAFCYIAMVGGELIISHGSYVTTSKLVIDESLVTSDYDTTRVIIRGEGDGNTVIISAHAGRCIQYSGGASGGLGAYVKYSGFRLRGSGVSGGVGLWADNVAWLHLEDVTISEFDRGIDGTDVLSTVIDSCRIRFNYMGYRFDYSDASRPNAITMRDCVVAANYTYGGLVTAVASFNVHGGTLEGNGQTAGVPTTGGYGLKVVDAGVEGISGLVMDGVYMEGNADKADVWITHSTGDVMHKISGCSFTRYLAACYVTNNILFERAGGNARLWIGGNGFGSFSPYTENAARRYVDGPAIGIVDAGNFYQSTTALPAASDTRGPYCGAFDDTGASVSMPKDWTVANGGTGIVTVTHNLGTTNYAVVATTIEAASERVERITKATNSFTVITTTSGEALANSAANFLVQLY